jgi:tripartite ATP-independent transporter DctM subunit
MLLFTATFLSLLLASVPIASALGMSATIYLLINGNLGLLLIFPQRMINSIDQFVLLSIPLFLLVGNLMNNGGITDRVLRFSNACVGHLRGGLSQVTIVASMFFGGVTGAAAADTSALGSVLIPAMAKEGYPKAYAAALLAICAVVGAVIPPSITMVVYGALAQVSVAQLFTAGIVPGVLIGFALLPYAWWVAKRSGYPVNVRVNMRERLKTTVQAAPVLVLPALILGGIMLGVFTPTESAAVAVVYMIFLAVCYRMLSWRNLFYSMADAALLTAAIMFIIAMASMVQFIFSYERIPQQIIQWMLSITDNKYLLLLLTNILLLILGMFLETIAAMILALPVLIEIAKVIQIDPVHFGTIVVINLSIGLATPPVGMCLFIASGIAKEPIEKVSLAMLPMIAIAIAILMIVTYVPAISLFLPSLFFDR